MRFLTFFLTTFLLLALICTSSQAITRRALVVAIDEYADPAVRPLHGSVNDGNAMVDLLRKQLGFADEEILYLKNSEATRQAILDGMDNWLVAGTKPGDKVFFYYAGHGYYIFDSSGDEKDEAVPLDEAICPHDTDTATMNDAVKKGNMIIDDEIALRLEQLDGRQVVSIFDSCHAGTSTRSLTMDNFEGVRALNLVPQPATRGAGADDRSLVIEYGVPRAKSDSAHAWSEEIDSARAYSVFLAAASPTEEAREIVVNGKKHGALTYALLQSFDRRDTASLADVVAEFAEVRQSHHAVTQHPSIEGNPGLANRSLRALFDVSDNARTADLALATVNDNREYGLSLRINNGVTRLRVNDPIRFHVRSDLAGYLYLFDIVGTGDMYMIYPNKWSRLAGIGNLIQGRQDLSVPPKHVGGSPVSFQFYADQPGRETIMALLTREPWPEMDAAVGPATAEAKSLSSGQAAMIRDLLFKRQAGRNLVLAEEDPLFQENDWAGAVLEIEISR